MTNSYQAYNDACVARFANPDPELVQIGGKEWGRVRPLRCCNCGELFFGWTPIDSPLPSYVVDSAAPGVPRLTCGHPSCAKLEDERAWRERVAIRQRQSVMNPQIDAR